MLKAYVREGDLQSRNIEIDAEAGHIVKRERVNE